MPTPDASPSNLPAAPLPDFRFPADRMKEAVFDGGTAK